MFGDYKIVLGVAPTRRDVFPPREFALKTKAAAMKRVYEILGDIPDLEVVTIEDLVPDGLLMDIADIVIDNCGVPGDCAVQMEGVAAAVCPTSSMANTFIAQAISVQCAYYIKEKGVTPPVFVSLNSEGTEHVNDEYFEKYTRMYKKARL